ncbi:hypothetical protein SeMB42_g01220 [Synchytrium endobioticum]|uniref:Uncharacterized protein n=1 Tax=Synchytrium endobioticum TaxID=286115 RepID=A0A507DM96_9FUNG|nr:hypothetical protein SeMB42_g01220 [Synchytrium endobioticum]
MEPQRSPTHQPGYDFDPKFKDYVSLSRNHPWFKLPQSQMELVDLVFSIHHAHITSASVTVVSPHPVIKQKKRSLPHSPEPHALPTELSGDRLKRSRMCLNWNRPTSRHGSSRCGLRTYACSLFRRSL